MLCLLFVLLSSSNLVAVVKLCLRALPKRSLSHGMSYHFIMHGENARKPASSLRIDDAKHSIYYVAKIYCLAVDLCKKTTWLLRDDDAKTACITWHDL